jgi:hypothetical protein
VAQVAAPRAFQPSRTYENPKEFRATCGFDNEKEQQLLPMLAYNDVHKETM